MISNYGENIYKILSELIGLKFKAQIKDSGIEFKKFYRITDLETNAVYYTLITNGKQINFENKAEFIKEFISYLENNINKFDKQFEELQKISNDRWVDENQLFIEHEEIGRYGHKLSKLLKKIKGIEKNIG